MSDLPAEPARGAIERRRRFELTPADRSQRRRNRHLILFIAVPALVVGGAALAAAVLASSSAPSVNPAFVPAGYKAVTDGYFGYAVPASWSTSDLFTDNVGDLETAGTGGWVAEHVGPRSTAPPPGQPLPAVFNSLGSGSGTYRLGPAQPIQVAGAQVAYRYSVLRSGGFNASAVDAWQPSGAELWLLVAAPPQVTAQIEGSLKA